MDSHEESLARLIGARVKRERKALDWTLDHLAEAAEVSRRMVVNVEQGAVNPSVGTLLRLSDALGVGLPSLVETADQPASKLVRSGDIPVLWSGEHGGRGRLVVGTEPPDIVELWDWELGPGDRHESEAHAPHTRELAHVLDGAIVIDVGAERHELSTGDALTFFGDADHAYSNPHDEPARFSLSVYEPGVRTKHRTEKH
ncbi:MULTISPECIES: helix-turn-helix domain-containing protein [unclassified Brevibacterium]|jgi:transcriptional regulator with XRE-family HTH domain|uniref:helix-turn-helix domain-containing protein n=1 Tax=unclassified Brevibacterium TaxID=2614124 RepID=UPI0010926CFC|nr:XRE family transcriptional regulator [Brevibacterium sp. S22]TGD30181.1 XRE family transcriptional regulator [Brevibacterium sp. S22]